jgi:hypothetical protein
VHEKEGVQAPSIFDSDQQYPDLPLDSCKSPAQGSHLGLETKIKLKKN